MSFRHSVSLLSDFAIALAGVTGAHFMPTNSAGLHIVAPAVLLLVALAVPAWGQSPVQNDASQPTDASAPKPSLITPLKPQTEGEVYRPITARQRLRWFITNPIMPSHLVGGVFTSALGTAADRPKEYGPGWPGFADRFGMRLTGIVTSNAIEASAGAIWGEDPRYFRTPEAPFKLRVKSVFRQTFEARRRDGDFAPAYARYLAYSGNNFLSNEWRVSSEANVHDALLRTGEAFLGRLVADAFAEFGPDIERRIF